ncbi:MAG: helix-turn-helix domain-containing protein [Chitinophagaceae bacterium]|jgi:transcriptional regulator with XRE-family HTH domain|nr:helix-turn-helix domain-containing protein [Chitinophagaceae bacterium]
MPISKKQKLLLKNLGQKLKLMRQAKGLTLKELGYRVDKDPQSISRVEMGDINPTYLYLMQICEGLEIEMTDLFK